MPVPRRAHALVLREPRGEALLLLRLRRGRRRLRVRPADRGARLPGGRRAAGRALRTCGSSARTTTRARRSAAAGASGCSRCSSGRAASTPPTWRVGRGGAGARVPGRHAACRTRCSREFRVGYSPSAWDRMMLGARQSGFSEEELVAAGLAQRGQSGGLYDRFRGRIMFPLADCARAGARLRRAGRWGRGAGRSTSTPPRTTSTTRAASCSASTWPARRRCAPVGSWSWRVTPTCLRSTRRGFARPWPSWARR